MTITTGLDQVRLLIGDTDPDAPELSDEEVTYFLTQRASNVLLAAADACDALAAKWARAYDFGTDGQTFDRSAVHGMYLEMAARFRARGQGVATLDTTRVDGYSQTIRGQDVLATGTTARSRYYGRRDALP